MAKGYEIRVVRASDGKWIIEESEGNRPWAAVDKKKYHSREAACREAERLSKMSLFDRVAEMMRDPLDAEPNRAS